MKPKPRASSAVETTGRVRCPKCGLHLPAYYFGSAFPWCFECWLETMVRSSDRGSPAVELAPVPVDQLEASHPVAYRAAIASLTYGQIRTFTAHYHGRQPVSAIARGTGRSPASVSTQLGRIRSAFVAAGLPPPEMLRANTGPACYRSAS